MRVIENVCPTCYVLVEKQFRVEVEKVSAISPQPLLDVHYRPLVDWLGSWLIWAAGMLYCRINFFFSFNSQVQITKKQKSKWKQPQVWNSSKIWVLCSSRAFKMSNISGTIGWPFDNLEMSTEMKSGIESTPAEPMPLAGVRLPPVIWKVRCLRLLTQLLPHQLSSYCFLHLSHWHRC